MDHTADNHYNKHVQSQQTGAGTEQQQQPARTSASALCHVAVPLQLILEAVAKLAPPTGSDDSSQVANIAEAVQVVNGILPAPTQHSALDASRLLAMQRKKRMQI